MHEYQGISKLGKTTIIATGPAQEGKAAIIELHEHAKPKIKFVK